MTGLIRAEFSKLRRASMLLTAFAGASVTPLVSFAAIMLYPGDFAKTPNFGRLFEDVLFYTDIVVGPPLFAVLGSWMLIREFDGRTISSILSIPVSRSRFLASKFAAFALWMESLVFWSWLLTAGLGIAAGLDGATPALFFSALARFSAGCILLVLLTSPAFFLAVATRGFVPVIAFSAGVTLVSVVVSNSALQAVYPWTAIIPILGGPTARPCQPMLPYISLFSASASGFFLSFFLFDRMDIT